jgi:energy-coupling factor transporter transmembrane protein EcfT
LVVNLFSYRKAESLLHKTNAGVKLIFLIFFSSLIFLKQRWIAPLLLTALSFCLALLLFFMAKIPVKKIFQLKLLVFIGFLFALFKSLSLDIQFSPRFQFLCSFSLQDGLAGLFWGFNFFTASFFALIFFDTTSMSDLQDSFHSVQKKLSRFIPILEKIPLANALALTISFIPEVFSLWGQIKKASLARQNTRSHVLTKPKGVFKKKYKKKLSLRRQLAVFLQEFSTLISLLLLRAMEKRKALLNRS